MASILFGQTNSDPQVQAAKEAFAEARAHDQTVSRLHGGEERDAYLREASKSWKKYHALKRELEKDTYMPIFHHIVHGRAIAPPKKSRTNVS